MLLSDAQEKEEADEDTKQAPEEDQEKEYEDEDDDEGEEEEEEYSEERSQLESQELEEDAMPSITSEQYNQYLRSLVKLLVGDHTIADWIRKGQSPVLYNMYYIKTKYIYIYILRSLTHQMPH